MNPTEFYRFSDSVAGVERWYEIERDTAAGGCQVVVSEQVGQGSSGRIETVSRVRTPVDVFLAADHPQAVKDALSAALQEMADE